MSRRKAAPKRKILPDPLFKSTLLAKFINCVMTAGKKSLAERIVYDALEQVVSRSAAKVQKQDDGEDGGEDCNEELDYFYVKGNVLDSKFKLPYIEVDNNNNTIEVSSEEIDVVEEIWEKVEWNGEFDFENDCGFDEIDETELDEILDN